jgi:CubicO group peptidase (beta-lactamase class C family)
MSLSLLNHYPYRVAVGARKHPLGVALIGLATLMMSAPSALAQDVDRIDRVIQNSVEQGEFSGSVLVARDGQILFDRGYGSANREWSIANDGDTVFRLGSLSKQFTAVAIMLLHERGAVALDAPLKTYIPDAPAAWDAITVRHLLTHTAGVPDFTRLDDYEELKTQPATVTSLIARFRDRPLAFEPGSGFAYSNSGYILLTAVIERASGVPYADFVSRNLFEPLGMAASGYDNAATVLPRRATGYVPTADGVFNAPFVDMSIPQGAGGLYSTTHDLLKWEQGLFSGQLLQPESLELLTKPLRNNYAFGLISTEQGNQRIISHSGAIEGFNTYMAHAADGTTVVVLGNLNGPGPDKLGPALMTLAHGGIVTLQSERQAISIAPQALNAFVGVYEAAPGFSFTISVIDGHLAAQATGQPAFELFAESADNFFLQVVDAQMSFVRDASGAVTGLILHQGGRDLPARRVD